MRLQWSDDIVFSVADAYLPAITNLQPHHHTKVEGNHCKKEFKIASVNSATATFTTVFSTFLAVTPLSREQFKMMGRDLRHYWWEYKSSLTLLYWSLCLYWQPILRPKKHMHLIACHHSWENHFLRSPVEKHYTSCSVAEWWTAHSLAALSVSVKGICYAVFTEWVRLSADACDWESCSVFVETIIEVPDNHAHCFWQNCWLFCSRSFELQATMV